MEEIIELWKRYLERTKGQRTLDSYVRHLKKFINTFEIQDLEDIKPHILYEYIDKTDLKPSSILAHLSAARNFFKFLYRRNYINHNVFSELENAIETIREELNTKKPPIYPKALSKEEVEHILQAVKGKKYEKIYTLFLYSGIRLIEFEYLERKCFYLDKSGILWIKLEPYMTKRNKGRLVPILGPTRKETFEATKKLLKWIESFEENFRIKRGILQVYTDRLSKKLNINFSIHSFRHTYITNLVNQGLPAEIVKEFAGHSNVRLTIDTYYKYSHRRAEEIVRGFLGFS